MSDWKAMKNSKAKYGRYLASREWGKLKEQVHKRANGKCERCRKNTIDAVHHLTYERIYCEKLEDLQAICTPCHEFTHGKSNIDPAAEPVFDSSPNPNRTPEPIEVQRRMLRYLASLADSHDPYRSDRSPYPAGINSRSFVGSYRAVICKEIAMAPWRGEKVTRDYIFSELRWSRGKELDDEVEAIFSTEVPADPASLVKEFHDEMDRYRLSAHLEYAARVLRDGASAERALACLFLLGANSPTLRGKLHRQMTEMTLMGLSGSRQGDGVAGPDMNEESSPHRLIADCSRAGLTLWLEGDKLCCSGLSESEASDYYFHLINHDADSIREVLRRKGTDKTVWTDG